MLFLSYLGYTLYYSLRQQYGNTEQDLGNLGRFLVGILGVISAVFLGAWLNFRGPFRWWFLRPEKQTWYYVWLLGLVWILYELLQIRTSHDPVFVDENWLVAIVVVGLVVGFGYVADTFRIRRERLLLQQQKTKAELTALQTQLNPHFLFNALNTIYNEADAVQNDRVTDLVQQLSGLLRFTLQEAQKEKTTVASEIAFLEKYLALQRARLPQREDLRVNTHIEYDDQPAQIAPLLLIPFVENAFQYGISGQQASFIDLRLVVENAVLTLHIQNSLAPQTTAKRGNGTGIANVQQRLKGIYPHLHKLEIKQQAAIFEIVLEIKL